MAGGRPTSYSDEVLELTKAYLLEFDLEPNERSTPRLQKEVIPSVVGLCGYINRGKTTIYNWIADERYTEFRDTVEAIEEVQCSFLINGGLTGAYNSNISKLMLGRHGYSEKTELDHSSKDGSMTPPAPIYNIVDE